MIELICVFIDKKINDKESVKMKGLLALLIDCIMIINILSEFFQ